MVTISTDLQRQAFLYGAMKAFKKKLVGLTTFSLAIRNATLEGTNEIAVPYHPLYGTASADFNPANGYEFSEDASIQSKKVTVDKRKYQNLSITSEEARRQPHLDPMTLGELKGDKLAVDILNDIFSQITLANYGAAVISEAATAFTKEDVIDIQTACDEAEWPDEPRAIVTKPAYRGNVMKDSVVLEGGGSGPFSALRDGKVRELFGFDLITTNTIPANAQSLAGFVCHPSAMLVAFAPIEPVPSVRKQLVDYQRFEDDQVGLTLELREWGDPQMDTGYMTLECNYGYDLGETAALLRITSA